VKRLYISPLQRVRSDWPVTEIPSAGHLHCVIHPPFASSLVAILAHPTTTATPQKPVDDRRRFRLFKRDG
jgi:hypothetical protein